MQVFNSFQEMAAGTGALGTQGTMSVFNAVRQSAPHPDLDEYGFRTVSMDEAMEVTQQALNARKVYDAAVEAFQRLYNEAEQGSASEQYMAKYEYQI